MNRITLQPTSSGLWHVEGIDCNRILRTSRNLERQGRWADACECRADAVQQLLDVAGEESVPLDWNDSSSRAALELIYASAIDYFSIDEVEMATALWERVIDFDEEDHLQATIMLAFCYVELEDYDCLESVISDISPKAAEYSLLMLWSTYRQTQGVERDALREMRTRHKVWWEEFVASEHPADEVFLADRQSERPSHRTEAREFWFATAPMWERNKDFIEAISKA